MTKNKRKMVRVLDIEEFAANKQALMHFESQMEELGGLKVHLSDSRVLQLMSRTSAAVWGNGRDLYLASQERTLAMITRMVVSQFDEAISEAVKTLAEWLQLRITYTRTGSDITFRFQKESGETKELQIPMRRPEPTQYVN